MARLASTLALLLALSLSTLTLAATSTSTVSDTATATAASIYPGGTSWAYFGCYNETTLYNGTNGQRALNGGLIEAMDTMTVEICLNYCRGNGYQVAGLEYTRECYCANYLSSLSAHLPDSSCSLDCKGNSSEICGGYLALSVYKVRTTDSGAKGVGVNIRPDKGVGSLLALGIALTALLAWA